MAILLPSDADWEERHLKWKVQSEQHDGGADPAILMCMLHRYIDLLFSLTPWRPGNCLSVFLLFKLTTFWHSSSSYQQWKPQQNNNGSRWTSILITGGRFVVDIFIQHSEDPNNVVSEADFTIFCRLVATYILYTGHPSGWIFLLDLN